MKVLLVVISLLVFAVSTVAFASPALKMRPYAGIGILLLPTINVFDNDETLPIYEEPALSRLGELNRTKLPAFEWIFGASPDTLPVIVMSRKGSWLRVVYDDAGREAWLRPPRKLTFQLWELFFKSRISRMLPGLQNKYYQVSQQPDSVPMAILTHAQLFKVLRIENDWAMVLIDQNSLGWLRWQDEDGRLLIGIESQLKVRQP